MILFTAVYKGQDQTTATVKNEFWCVKNDVKWLRYNGAKLKYCSDDDVLHYELRFACKLSTCNAERKMLN